MNNKRHFFRSEKAGFVLGAVALLTLSGCVARFEGPRVAVRSEPVFAAEDDYVYYPSYEVYYSNSRRQYAYVEGGGWVSRPGPRGVTVDVLLASPSVRMDFHDSPAHHHAEMVRRYPRNWVPPGSNQGRKDNRQDEHRDERGDNNHR